MANSVNTQIEDHKRFGGVYPELASRLHLENITAVLSFVLSLKGFDYRTITHVAVTGGPAFREPSRSVPWRRRPSVNTSACRSLTSITLPATSTPMNSSSRSNIPFLPSSSREETRSSSISRSPSSSISWAKRRTMPSARPSTKSQGLLASPIPAASGSTEPARRKASKASLSRRRKSTATTCPIPTQEPSHPHDREGKEGTRRDACPASDRKLCPVYRDGLRRPTSGQGRASQERQAGSR